MDTNNRNHLNHEKHETHEKTFEPLMDKNGHE